METRHVGTSVLPPCVVFSRNKPTEPAKIGLQIKNLVKNECFLNGQNFHLSSFFHKKLL